MSKLNFLMLTSSTVPLIYREFVDGSPNTHLYTKKTIKFANKTHDPHNDLRPPA